MYPMPHKAYRLKYISESGIQGSISMNDFCRYPLFSPYLSQSSYAVHPKNNFILNRPGLAGPGIEVRSVEGLDLLAAGLKIQFAPLNCAIPSF